MSSLRVSGICSIVGYRLRFRVSFLESVANNPPFSSPFVGNPASRRKGWCTMGVPPTLPHVPPHVTTGYGRNSLNLDGDEALPRTGTIPSQDLQDLLRASRTADIIAAPWYQSPRNVGLGMFIENYWNVVDLGFASIFAYIVSIARVFKKLRWFSRYNVGWFWFVVAKCIEKSYENLQASKPIASR